MFPYAANGPKRTPPIPGYEAEDGDYVDTTRTFAEHQNVNIKEIIRAVSAAKHEQRKAERAARRKEPEVPKD